MQGIGLIVGPLSRSRCCCRCPAAAGMANLARRRGGPPLAVFWARRHLKETLGSRNSSRRRGCHRPKAAQRLRHRAQRGVRERCKAPDVADRHLASVVFPRSRVLWEHDFEPSVCPAVSPKGTMIQNLFVSLLVFAFAAFPGYLLSVYGMDKWGRKFDPAAGFALMAQLYRHRDPGRRLSDHCSVRGALLHQLLLHGIWAEHDDLRHTCRNISDQRSDDEPRYFGHGRQGRAAVGTFSFPLLQATFGLRGPMWTAAVRARLVSH